MNAYFEEIEFHLGSELKSASERILIAIAWFTNARLADILIDIKKRNVDVEIIVDDNNINRSSKALANLEQNGVFVNYIKNLVTNKALMHNKFTVIDNRKVITGSYNWTVNIWCFAT